MNTLDRLREELLAGTVEESARFHIEPIEEANAESDLRNNDWQNMAFNALKSKDADKQKASLHNKKLWNDLAKSRRLWNAAVKKAQKEAVGL